MADSIVRLQLDSQNYDANIKRATDNLMRYEAECRKVGGTMEVVEKETLDYVKALGEMQTKSKTTKGQIGELTKGYTELGMQYKRLTDAEKQSPYGQAMAKSLDQLKGRIQETRKGLKEVEESLKDVEEEAGGGGLAGKLDELAGKFGLNIKQLTGWGAVLAVATGALKIMKDAVNTSDASIDWWGDKVEKGKTVYEAFLQSLNNGDFSGFLSRIGEVIQAAENAYGAMDALGTLQILNQRKVGEKNVEIERMRAMLRTGRYIAPNDGRQASMANGALLSDAQKKGIAKDLESAMGELRGFMHEELSATDAAIKGTLGKLGVVNGVSAEEVIRLTRDNASLSAAREGYQKWYAAAYGEGGEYYMLNGNRIKKKAKANEWDKWKDYGWTLNFNEESENFKQLNELYKSSQDIQRGIIANYAGGYKNINTIYGITPRLQGGGAGSAPSLIGGAVGALPYMPAGSFDFGGAGLALLQRNMAGALNGVQGYREEKKPVDPEKQLEAFNSMIGGLESVAGGLEAMGIELPEGVSKLLNGIGGLITVIQGISAVIVATQAILEMNTAAQFIPFAHGGVVRAANGWVGGNSWSGDRVPALLNSGELVLNRAQQGNLASQLNGAGWQNLRLETEISGTNLRIVLNNESRSRGRGVYVTR